VYIGLPAGFSAESTELPALLVGAYEAEKVMSQLAGSSGIRRRREATRTLLYAEGSAGESYVTPLRTGVLAAGDYESVMRMVSVAEGQRAGLASESAAPLDAGGPGREILGAGRVPQGLRSFLRTAGGGLGAPFASVDRLSFQATLGRTIDVRASLQPTTAEGRQGIEQALGALQLFGPSRFADDPEVLSAIQSLRVTPGPAAVGVSVSLTRSLLLRLL
ncbi:MAG: hypothetical protein H0V09_10915, partial [Gemmatimonadetes bacterium]|nr:hypothetical protein [Gemmatimonadota bacterium]